MTTYVEVGRFLSQARQQRGLSRDDVARTTKIPPTLVEALEEGLAERFPERVFLMNYVRSYALAIGISADDALGRLAQVPEAAKASEPTPQELEKTRRLRAWVVFAVVAVAALLVGGAALIAMSRPPPGAVVEGAGSPP